MLCDCVRICVRDSKHVEIVTTAKFIQDILKIIGSECKTNMAKHRNQGKEDFNMIERGVRCLTNMMQCEQTAVDIFIDSCQNGPLVVLEVMKATMTLTATTGYYCVRLLYFLSSSR